MNPLHQMQALGQSAWLDYIRRDFVLDGQLQQRIKNDGVSGLTSNPAIFEKAMGSGAEYAHALRALKMQGHDAMQIYETLAIEDIRAAADQLNAQYERTHAIDGYVSLEVSPHLANDTAGTITEGRRLWQRVDRANLMIKVPATAAGIVAIEALLREGINVNVTLLFSVDTYVAVANAYVRALQARQRAGLPIERLASVASFFISRIDALLDPQLPSELQGQTAIANAGHAYAQWERIFSSAHWRSLATLGAQPQRLLWASTSTKNPAYRDVMYVEALIGPHTVNTLPPATLEAFRDHGIATAQLHNAARDASATLQAVAGTGVSLERATDQLLRDGVQLFVHAFDQLLTAVDQAGSARATGGGTNA